jgi:hypothetical protein
MTADRDRPPWWQRCLDLCRQGYDINAARLISESEWKRKLDGNELERPIRLTGFDRGLIG